MKMIESVELNNFISYKNNIIKFDNGITALIGHNGAGKSAIMDGVMFSLCGEIGRDVNIPELQKEGESQMYTKTTFKIKGEKYIVLRQYANGKKKKVELQNESGVLIAKDVTTVDQKINELIGLDKNTLKIASIVPADELNSIISNDDEFRKLINKVLGAEKFKKLDDILKNGKNQFKNYLKEKFQYSYEDIEYLEREFQEKEKEIRQSIPERESLKKNRTTTENNIKKIEEEILNDLQKEKQLEVVKAKKEAFISYVKKEIEKEREKEQDNKKRHDACQGKIALASQKNMLEKKLEDLKLQMDENSKELGELKNKKSVSEKALELTDALENGTCPVCNSKVEQLDPKYQKEHIESEISDVDEKITYFENTTKRLNDGIQNTTEQLEKAREAVIVLSTNNIESEIQLQELSENLKSKIKKIQKIEIAINSGQLLEASSIDITAEQMFSAIIKIEKESKGFDHNEFRTKKNFLSQNRQNLEQIIENSGRIENKIISAEKRIDELKPIIKELKLASEFISEISEIKDTIFTEKSKTFVGLRYFALRKISEKASSYLETLGTSVIRVNLKEINKKIETECDTIKGKRAIGGLSTGEQRCVALAIRLAMSELMSRTPLKTIMLDEPTANMDRERCNMFLEALSKLSNSLNQNFQFIISTHQDDLWANNKVGRLYKLENPNDKGTILTEISRQ